MRAPTAPPMRVLVVDDQSLLVDAFALLISSQPDLVVVGTAADGAAALDRLRERPGGIDLVLMDIRMPVMDGISTLTRMRADPALAGVPVLILTTFDEEDLVLGALRAGARGFLLKDAEAPVLLQAVRAVAAGGSWLDPAVTSTVLAHLGEEAPPVASAPRQAMLLEPLTSREREVLELVCEGLSNADIGSRLFLAESTVKTHVKAVLGKTACRNRVELIVHAYRTGLVSPAATC